MGMRPFRHIKIALVRDLETPKLIGDIVRLHKGVTILDQKPDGTTTLGYRLITQDQLKDLLRMFDTVMIHSGGRSGVAVDVRYL
jgi:hypothetical protein